MAVERDHAAAYPTRVDILLAKTRRTAAATVARLNRVIAVDRQSCAIWLVLATLTVVFSVISFYVSNPWP